MTMKINTCLFVCFIPKRLPHLCTFLCSLSYGIGSVLGNFFPLLAKHGEYLAGVHCSIQQHSGEKPVGIGLTCLLLLPVMLMFWKRVFITQEGLTKHIEYYYSLLTQS